MGARAEIQPVIDRYLAAYAAHDADACAALYSDDAVVISPFGPPAIGRAEIAAAHRAWFADGETGKTMTVLRAGIAGDIGHCLVAFSADVPGDTAPERFHGASLNTLIRTAEGWRLTLTSLNATEDDLTRRLP